MRNNLRLIRRALNGNEAATDELGEEIDIGELLCCEIEQLREEVIITRNAIRLMIGRATNTPWSDVSEDDVEGYVKYMRVKAAEAKEDGDD